MPAGVRCERTVAPGASGASGRQLGALDDLQSRQVRRTEPFELADDKVDALADQPPG